MNDARPFASVVRVVIVVQVTPSRLPWSWNDLLAPLVPNWTLRVKPWLHRITGFCAPAGIGADVVRVMEAAADVQVTELSVLVEARLAWLLALIATPAATSAMTVPAVVMPVTATL